MFKSLVLVGNRLKKNNDKIKHKLNHTFNVVKNALIISLDLELSKEDLYIALLGLTVAGLYTKKKRFN